MDEAYYIRCHGANLRNGFAEGPNKFTILTDEKCDVTQLRIGFEGPAQPDVKLVTKKNRNVDVTYVTAVGGDYKIHILYKGHQIFSSPFGLKIVGDVEASVKKVTCSGNVKLAKRNEENIIVIDGRTVGIAGGISARVVGPSLPLLRFFQNEDDTLSLSYTITAKGMYKMFLKFLHYNVPGSPFQVRCE